MIIPPKLRAGDLIRVVSPARSLAILSEEQKQIARSAFTDLGLRLSFSEHAAELDRFYSSPIASRVADLHQAFADPSVRGIFSTIGGYNSNQLLTGLDYDLIAANPKILCGYSDITALACAIYARTGIVTYSGPHYSTFGMRKGNAYTRQVLQSALFRSDSFELLPSDRWSDEPWYRDQENRTFIQNPGYQALQPGTSDGTLIGGNLCTLNLLQGTPFMPDMHDCLLFVEDDEESNAVLFDRDLQSLLQAIPPSNLRGLVIGRFQASSNISPDDLSEIINSKPELKGIPVAAGFDFGHTTPIATLPIGGKAHLEIVGESVRFWITRH